MKTSISKNIAFVIASILLLIVLISFSTSLVKTITNVCKEEAYKLNTTDYINFIK